LLRSNSGRPPRATIPSPCRPFISSRAAHT
jgi:hypothetical protein